MRKLVFCMLMALCLCVFCMGCGGADSAVATQPEMQATVASAVTETQAIQTEETVPPTVETTAPAEETEATVSVPDAVDASRLPVLAPPEVEEGPCHYFDDAVFIGDSISYCLMVHHTKTGDLGNAGFMVRGSLSLHNTLSEMLTVYYQGKSQTPWDALAESDAKKVFIMLGANDIGYFGIDAAMEKWAEFIGKIQEKRPDLQIIIQSQTPMWTEANQNLLNNDNIDIYNQRLKEFAQANNCEFLDIAPYFKDATNGLAQTYVSDLYVHINPEGTEVWAKVLKAYAAEQEKETP